MKRIIVSACLLLTFVFGLPTLEQAQRRNAQRNGRRKHTTGNRLPEISSFKAEAATVTMPCPDWGSSLLCSPNANFTLTLTTDASDSDGDALLYEYTVTGGKINGEGRSVSWDYYGLKPGSYTAKVVVNDQHGGSASASTNITVAVCTACDPPCTDLNMSCPQIVEEGRSIVFSVSISGGETDMKPTYIWSVTAGTITKGQGTYTIEVDTTGLAGKQVIATVEVGDIPPECQRTASCEVQIHKKD
jgi:hypothetical protein